MASPQWMSGMVLSAGNLDNLYNNLVASQADTFFSNFGKWRTGTDGQTSGASSNVTIFNANTYGLLGTYSGNNGNDYMLLDYAFGSGSSTNISFTSTTALTTGSNRVMQLSGSISRALPVGTWLNMANGGVFIITTASKSGATSLTGNLSQANVAANETGSVRGANWTMRYNPNDDNIQPLWSVDLGDSAYISTILSGAIDDALCFLFNRLVTYGQGNAILRPMWELNGNWFAWGILKQQNIDAYGSPTASAAKYQQAYKRVVSLARNLIHGQVYVVPNSFTWEFNSAYVNVSYTNSNGVTYSLSASTIENTAFPAGNDRDNQVSGYTTGSGQDWVDYIGTDIYNSYSNSSSTVTVPNLYSGTGSIAANSSTITGWSASSRQFQSSDVGKMVQIYGAGTQGFNVAGLSATLTSGTGKTLRFDTAIRGAAVVGTVFNFPNGSLTLTVAAAKGDGGPSGGNALTGTVSGTIANGDRGWSTTMNLPLTAEITAVNTGVSPATATLNATATHSVSGGNITLFKPWFSPSDPAGSGAYNSYINQLTATTNFATSLGKPIGISEWENMTRMDGRGGNDDPNFVQLIYDFCADNTTYTTNTTTNNVAYETKFAGLDGGPPYSTSSSVPYYTMMQLNTGASNGPMHDSAGSPNSAIRYRGLFGNIPDAGGGSTGGGGSSGGSGGSTPSPTVSVGIDVRNTSYLFG